MSELQIREEAMKALAFSDLTPYFALDRLNSWVRAKDGVLFHRKASFAKVIYWVKRKAILEASKKWHIGLRRVMTKVRCKTCGGDGVWVSWYEERRERCRSCRGTGTASLKFIETSIGPIRWHTPHYEWFSSSLDVYVPFPSFFGEQDEDRHYELCTNWQPGGLGRPLALDEVRRDMLILLHAWPEAFTFILQYHYRNGAQVRFRVPNIPVAEEWVNMSIEGKLSN